MFWGLIMEPKRRYMQEVKQPFHISMASLDVFACSDEPAQVLLNYDNRNYLLCTLQNEKIIQCPLDLNFEVGDVIAFATNGGSNVHLTGYVIQDEEDTVEESASEDEQDVKEKEDADGKRKKKLTEQLNNQPPKKKSKTEQLLDEADEYDSNDDESFSLSKYLNEEEEDSDNEFDETDDGDEEAENEEVSDEQESDEEEVSSMSDDEEKEVPIPVEINGKQKKKKKNIEVQENEFRASTASKIKTPNKQEKTPNKQDKTPKHEKKENKTPKQDKTPKESKTPKEKTPKQKSENATKSPIEKAKSPLKRTVEGGVVVQDIKLGEGQAAKPGKLLQVYYEGRLKQNNKVFDKLLQGQGFKFRLGKQEVIRGWDVGVNGMKVGGKRRIICPPNMAYGEKGSPPQIPPNSTLIFEVELKALK